MLKLIPAWMLKILAGIFIFIALYGLAYLVFLGSNLNRLSQYGWGAFTGAFIMLVVGVSGWWFVRRLIRNKSEN